MDTNLRKLCTAMSKTAIYFVVFIYSMTMVFGTVTDAQRKSLKEISFNVDKGSYSMEELFKVIESSSEFKMAFLTEENWKDLEVDIESNQWILYDFLEHLSSNSGLYFKRINETISVGRIEETKKEGNVQYVIDQINITGRVTDENGEPLPGATIVEKGTTNGTTTDIEGKFKLNCPENAILTISFVGYSTKEVPLNNRSVINVSLLVDSEQLDEVVVVGYGTQKEANLTTAVSTVKGKDLINQTTSDVRKALQGSIPGLQVIDQGGNPGNKDVQIRIRGITSVNSTNPLVFVDGVEQNINDVDVNTIENITVLKDAASTAIYGSRAANGVILITTKRGSKDEFSVTYNGYYGRSNITTFPNPMDTRSYMEFRNLVHENSGAAIPYPDIDQYISNMEKYPDLYPKAFPEWDEFYQWAPLIKHSFVITGGTNTLSSMVNVSFEDEEGVLPNSQKNNYQFRTNNELQLTDNIKAFFNTSLIRDDWSETNKSPDFYRWVSNMLDFTNPHYPDGSYGINNRDRNIWFLNDPTYHGIRNTVSDKAILSIGTEVNFLKDFTYKVRYNINTRKDATSANSPQYVLNQYWNESAVQTSRDINSYSENRVEELRKTLISLLTYERSFLDNHNVNVLLGYSQDENQLTGNFSQGQGFYNNELRNLSQGDPQNREISNEFSEWGLRSFFGRLSYNFSQKYLVEINARYDGSSRFPEGNKYTLFPSASAAWRVSDESFWDPILSVLNDFKIRYSYGVNGNQSIGNYSYIPQLNVSNAYVFADAGGMEGVVTGIGQTELASTELSWETTIQNNLGIDMGFVDNQLTLSVDLFNKTTDGILLDVPVPAVVGLNPSKTNAGIISNKGWEAVMVWRDQRDEFNYSISANASFVTDRVEDFGGLPQQTLYNDRYYREVGSPLFGLFGFVVDGFYQDQEDINNSAAWGSKAALFPGDLKYRDLSGPDGVPDGIISAEYDRAGLGYGTPRYYYGTTFNAQWKGLDFSMQWQGAGGHKVPLFGKVIEGAGWNGFTPHYANQDYWKGPGDTDARFPLPHLKPRNNIQSSDFWLVNGSYLRLKSLTIGYTLPEVWTNKIGLKKIRVYSSGINLLTFSELFNKWELEPEWSIGNMRYDYYPQTKSYNLGITVTL